ncbi:putative maltose permease [Microstroma glucosiphilum]|uniref:Putative maltose permease n=1 Tax=Pseudomicrostroma glucosiphilum TaxID=1684307 RepID=A0A316UGW3_9BASI|nr:putative maltose permease [Pseudomicrostroma glucosiphilum]PWN23173.1 putative maltose permease [Pseudomicrostroma glucosiphilum]
MSSAQADLANATEVTRIDDKAQAKVASKIEDYDAMLHDAAQVTQEEQSVGIWETIRRHPYAIMWVMLFGLGLVQEGYDLMLLSSFYAQPAFTRRFGTCNAAGVCEISAPWQSGLNNGALVGEILGLQVVGVVSERFGYRKTMMVSSALMVAFIFIPFFATSLPVLLVGQILQGMPWGVFQTLTTTYAADIAPLQLRGVLTSYNNICWVMGQLLASGILRACLNAPGRWAYKIPYALQWVWPPIIIVACLFAPESPWWLVRQKRLAEAETSLRKLASTHAEFTHEAATAKINEMILTTELERETRAGARYFDCFKGTNLRRTEIGVMVYLAQVFGGAPLMGYSTYFFLQAGFSVNNSFNMTIGLFALGFVGTVLSWFAMSKFNRRLMFLFGLAVAVVILMVTGAVGAAAGDTPSGQWAIGAMLLLFTFFYDFTVGPVAYSLVAEVPSAQLRAKSVALSRNSYNLGGLIANAITPRMLNPDAWNWGAKSGFFWAGTACLWFLWCFFRLPDPTGRTYLELDALFEAKVPARKFRTTRLELFGAQQDKPVHASSSLEKISSAGHEKEEGNQTQTHTATYNA